MRKEETVEGALQAKAKNSRKDKDKKNNKRKDNKIGNNNKNQKSYPPCPHCKKINHP